MNAHITEEDREILDMLREVVWDAAELREDMQSWEYDAAYREVRSVLKDLLVELVQARREQ